MRLSVEYHYWKQLKFRYVVTNVKASFGIMSMLVFVIGGSTGDADAAEACECEANTNLAQILQVAIALSAYIAD